MPVGASYFVLSLFETLMFEFKFKGLELKSAGAVIWT